MLCPYCQTETSLLPGEEQGDIEVFCPNCDSPLSLPHILKGILLENPFIYTDIPCFLETLALTLSPGHLTICWLSFLIEAGLTQEIWAHRGDSDSAFLSLRKEWIPLYQQKTNLSDDIVARGLALFCDVLKRTLPISPPSGSTLHEIEQRAFQGDLIAQEELGFAYIQGWLLQKNEGLGFYWMEQSAAQNHPSALRRLAGYYLTATGTSISIDQALQYTKKACEREDSIACSNMGVFFKEKEESEEHTELALHWWTKSAKLGNSIAQCHLGDYYRFEDQSDSRYTMALYWYTEAAQQNCPEALCSLAYCCEDGFGMPPDEELAFSYFQRAAQLGYSQAQFHLGTYYEYGIGTEIDLNQSLIWYTKAAVQKNLDAYVALADWLHPQLSMEENSKVMVYWCEKAASRGHGEAAFHLGIHCSYQNLRPQSFHWLEKAVQGGYHQAKPFLACCYQWGLGTEKDIHQAFRIYLDALDEKNPYAIAQLGFMHEVGLYAEVNLERAGFYYELLAKEQQSMMLHSKLKPLLLSAHHQDPQSQYQLGMILYEGKKVQQQLHWAFYWLTMASWQGHLEAQFTLHCFGNGLQNDSTQDARWYQKLAHQGYPNAQFYLGRCYEEGYGVVEKPELAYHWYLQAARQDHPQAQYYLSECYTSGYGTNTNYETSAKWYQKAIENGYIDEDIEE